MNDGYKDTNDLPGQRYNEKEGRWEFPLADAAGQFAPTGLMGWVAETTEGHAILLTQRDMEIQPGPDWKWDKVANEWVNPDGSGSGAVDLGMPQYQMNQDGNDPTSPVMRDLAFNRHSKNADGRLVQGIDEKQLQLTLSRAIRATTGIKLDEPYEPDDWEEMLRGGLQTALETQVIVFEVQGASRALTHQLVRSRRAAFHQQSQRATFMGVRPNIRIPETVARNPRASEAFIKSAEMAAEAYNIACEEDLSYENARYILPEGTTNYILCEYSIREFMAVYAYRACSMFMTEMVYCVRRMGAALKEAHPFMDRYVKISCETSKGNVDGGTEGHHCTFQGWETVDGQCDMPWAREENRSFRSKRHGIG